MFWYLIGILVLAFLIFFFYMGFHKQVVIYEKTLDPMYFVYREYLGSYREIGAEFDKIVRDSKSCRAKDFIIGGIYYDNPDVVSDHSKERSAIGLFINSSERDKAEEFVRIFKQYQLADIPSIKVRITSRFPFKNILSFVWMRVSIYPSLYDETVIKEICPNLSPFLIEFYPYTKSEGRSIISAVPYEAYMKYLVFTKAEQPPTLADKKNN